MPKISISKIGFEIEGEWTDTLRAEVAHRFPAGDFVGDGSIQNCGQTRHAGKSLSKHEFRSPAFPLKSWKQDTRPLFQLLDRAWDTGSFHNNESCGFHVHLSFSPRFVPELFSPQFVSYFARRAKKFYPDIFAERTAGRWCKPIVDLKEYSRESARYDRSTRYRFINLWNAWKSHKTIEVRLWPGAKPSQLRAYLRFTIETIELFLAKPLHKLQATPIAEAYTLPEDDLTIPLPVLTTDHCRHQITVGHKKVHNLSVESEIREPNYWRVENTSPIVVNLDTQFVAALSATLITA